MWRLIPGNTLHIVYEFGLESGDQFNSKRK